MEVAQFEQGVFLQQKYVMNMLKEIKIMECMSCGTLVGQDKN